LSETSLEELMHEIRAIKIVFRGELLLVAFSIR